MQSSVSYRSLLRRFARGTTLPAIHVTLLKAGLWRARSDLCVSSAFIFHTDRASLDSRRPCPLYGRKVSSDGADRPLPPRASHADGPVIGREGPSVVFNLSN